MRDMTVTYDLPTTRKSGRSLAVSDISGVEISLSADNGENFAVLGTVAPPATSLTQTELEVGDYILRLVVIDSLSRRSDAVDMAFIVADNTAPGTVRNVEIVMQEE